jgi:AcrR family transcriptional regulator
MRGFTDDERDRIRAELVERGRELLVTLGPEKITVEDVTEPAGIAKGTFYRFFDSKADLYLEVFDREMDAFTDRVESDLDGVDDPREGLERLFRAYVSFAEDNPLVQRTVIQGDYRAVFRNVSDERLASVERRGVAELVPHVEALAADADGPLADTDPVTVLGLMGASLGLMVLHREEFDRYDEDYYEQVKDTAIATLARGLTVSE